MRNTIILAALLLAGCAGNTAQNATEALVTACTSYAGSLRVLTTMRVQGTLSDKAALVVDKAVNVISPICTAPTAIPDQAGALVIVNNELAPLAALIPTK